MIEPVHAFLAHVAVSASRSPYHFAFRTETVRFEHFQEVHELEIGVLFQETRVDCPSQKAEKHTQPE